MITTDTAIRPATLRDLKYIEALRGKLSYELGFIPKIALENRITGVRGGGVTLATENDEACGFLHFGSQRSPVCRIFQAAIQYDAQRRHHGLEMVEDFLDQCRRRGTKLVSLHCLADLPSNEFWKMSGFRRAGVEMGAKGPLRHWVKSLETIEDLWAPGYIPVAIPRRTHACRGCGKLTTLTFGPKGQIWKLCRPCKEKASRRVADQEVQGCV